MRLRELRDWARARFSQGSPQTQGEVHAAAQEARETRADHVVALQAEVRKLQQDITDLSGSPDGGTEGRESTADPSRLAVLEKELEEKQRELAQFQGRV